MMRGRSEKVVLATLLAAAAAASGAPPDRVTVLLVAFGLVNILWTPPGTTWVRGISIASAVSALFWDVNARDIAIVILAAVWPPSFMVAWALARENAATDDHDRDGHTARYDARRTTAVVIVAIAVASLTYQVIRHQGLQQSAALFVGIPTVLALVVVFGVSPRSATGVACKAVTIGLLVSLIFLGEGMLCIAMSAPLFYAVAVIVGKAAEFAHRPPGRRAHTMFSWALVLVLAPMSLEGVTDSTSFGRDEWVSETRIVQASASDVEAAVFQPPRFDRVLPAYLRVGFPRPTSTRIEGQSRWVVRMRGGEMRLDGIEPRAGDLVLQLVARQPGSVRWRALSDDSHMTHFLDWHEAIVQWVPIDGHSTRVTWTLRYRRGLDPAWYFGAWERYAARLAAGYLIDTVATP